VEIATRIAELESQLADQRRKIEFAVARLRATEAELDSLRSGSPHSGNLAVLDRTDAVVWALHSTDTSASPSEIVRVLRDHGRDDTLKLVTATLDCLGRKERVRKVERGRYVPT
jgi:hypothetical protein